MRAFLLGIVALGALPIVVSARDVYGNATLWTNSDTIIWELHQQQNAFKGGSSGPSWQEQIAGREAQKRLAAQDAARSARDKIEVDAYMAKRKAEYVPLTWAQEMERYIMQNGDRAAAEGERLAFYYVETGNLAKARRHLELVVFRKRPRAGEAAWQLYRLHKADGLEPDAALATQYLDRSVALGYSDGLWKLASTQFLGDSVGKIPPNQVGALPLLEQIFRQSDSAHAGDAGRLMLTYDLQTPGREAHALEIMRRLAAMGGTDWISAGMTLADLLIKSPGGWKEHHAEILQALRTGSADFFAQDLLARVYLGLNPSALPYVPRNDEAANSAVVALAQLSRGDACLLLQQILPRGPDQRLPQAEKLLQSLVEHHPQIAEYGERYAQVLSGDFGGPGDLSAALRIYRKLAAAPDATPTVLATTARLLTLDRPGAAPDFAEAFPLFQQAALADEPYAQYRYADALRRGLGCVADPAAALDYLQKATNYLNPTPARYPLFALAAKAIRESAPKDRDQLHQAWSRAAGAPGFALAQLEVARCLYALATLEQADDRNRDYPQKAFDQAEKAARTGLDEARLLLARFFREGFGVKADAAAAFEIYEEGAKSGVAPAMAALAEIKLDRSTRFYDAASGFVWATKAAEAGDARGAFLLSRSYRNGEGTPPNPTQATEWLARSAASGLADALNLQAGERLTNTSTTPEGYALAITELQQASEAGSLDATVRLLRTLSADPTRTPERLQTMNRLMSSARSLAPPMEETALVADFERVVGAADQLVLLTGQKRDPELSYQTARWLLGESSSLGAPTRFTIYRGTLLSDAAESGNLGAAYYLARGEIEAGLNYLADPEEDASAFKHYDDNYSTGHLATGLGQMRTAAAGGHPEAITYLRTKGIPVISTAPADTVDRASLLKISPAALGERREGEYVLARRALRKAHEALANPKADAAVMDVVGHTYSDEYFEEALNYFRSSAAAEYAEAIAFLEKCGIALERTVPEKEFDRVAATKLRASAPQQATSIAR